MVREAFPSVTFTDIWVRGREVWAYGDEADEVVDIWSVYEGDVGQIDSRVRNRFRTRVVDTLREMGVTASPVTRFITKKTPRTGFPRASDLLTTDGRRSSTKSPVGAVTLKFVKQLGKRGPGARPEGAWNRARPRV